MKEGVCVLDGGQDGQWRVQGIGWVLISMDVKICNILNANCSHMLAK